MNSPSFLGSPVWPWRRVGTPGATMREPPPRGALGRRHPWENPSGNHGKNWQTMGKPLEKIRVFYVERIHWENHTGFKWVGQAHSEHQKWKLRRFHTQPCYLWVQLWQYEIPTANKCVCTCMYSRWWIFPILHCELGGYMDSEAMCT